MNQSSLFYFRFDYPILLNKTRKKEYECVCAVPCRVCAVCVRVCVSECQTSESKKKIGDVGRDT